MGVVHYVILLPEGNSAQIVQCRAQVTLHAAVLYHRSSRIDSPMPDTCVAYGCRSRAGKTLGLGFYRFPAQAQRRELWEKAVARKDWHSKDHSRVCGRHFIHGTFCLSWARAWGIFLYSHSVALCLYRKTQSRPWTSRLCAINQYGWKAQGRGPNTQNW